MNTKSIRTRVLISVAAFGLLASFARSGPPPSLWNRARPITTFTEAEAVGPDESVMMVCGACKSVAISEPRVGLTPKAQVPWFVIGSKHACNHCGGEITVVKGTTTDSMQHNCSMCGTGAAFCCAVASPASNTMKDMPGMK